MSEAVLDFETLVKAAPGAVADCRQMLMTAVQDCKQRPSCTKDRKVSLTFHVTPRESDPDDVMIELVVTGSSPARKHEPFVARATKNNQLIFEFTEDEE